MEAPRRRTAPSWAGPVPAGDWRAGTRVGGRYIIEDLIGEGASAVTYRARDEVLGRLVALKVLRGRHARDPEVVARFEREARIAAAISHPNVVAVYDYGSDGGALFIVLQFVPGGDLRSAMDSDRPVPPAEAVRIGGELLAGLGAIHLAGIVHRDVKPSNVLFGRDGVVRVTDFGVAYEVVEDRLTSHGTTVGTAAYMAPEQARGGELTPATDLYAVGVVLFELLTGRLPFEHDNPMATLLAQIQTPPPRPSDVVSPGAIPPRLEAVVLRALAKNPAARFPTASAMGMALAESVGHSRRSEETTRLATPVVGAAPTTAARPAVRPPGSARTGLPIAGQAARSFTPTQRGQARAAARGRRRLRAWGLPLGGAMVALVVLAAIVLANSMNGGGGNGTPQAVVGGGGGSPPATATVAIAGEAMHIATATATATATEEAVETVPTAPTEIRLTTPIPPPTATDEATEAPASTSTIPATSTPDPTETAPPTATSPPLPTATSPPSPTPSPTAVPVDERTDGLSEAPPAGAGSGSTSGSSVPAGSDSFAIPADAWVGGEFRADVSGGPAVVLTSDGNNDRTSITFALDEIPAAGMTIELTGFEVVTDRPAEVEIEVNGRRVWEGESPFAVGGGAAWIAVELPLPADDFRVGENEVAVRFRSPGGRDGDDAGLALRGIRLLLPGSASNAGSGVAGEAVQVDETDDDGGAGGAAGSAGDGDTEVAPTIAPRGGR